MVGHQTFSLVNLKHFIITLKVNKSRLICACVLLRRVRYTEYRRRRKTENAYKKRSTTTFELRE